MADAQTRNPQLGAAIYSQNPMIGYEGAVTQLPARSTEIAKSAPVRLANPADFVIDDLESIDHREVDSVMLRDPKHFDHDGFENIGLQALPRRENVAGSPQQAGESNKNFLSNLNLNFDQLHMNFLRTRQPNPQQDPPAPARAPDLAKPEEFNMSYYKPRVDPKRPYFIGLIGILMAIVVTMSLLYGTCAVQNKRIRSTKPRTTVQTSISTITTTATATTTATITTPSTFTQSVTTSVPVTITISTTSLMTVTAISTIVNTPQPIVFTDKDTITSTLVITLPPVTITKTRHR